MILNPFNDCAPGPRPPGAPHPLDVLAEWETADFFVYEVKESHERLAFRKPDDADTDRDHAQQPAASQ